MYNYFAMRHMLQEYLQVHAINNLATIMLTIRGTTQYFASLDPFCFKTTFPFPVLSSLVVGSSS